MQKLLLTFITFSIIYFISIGSLLIVSPKGYLLSIPLSILNKSVLKDFLLPGWVMLLGVSLPLIVTFYQLITHRKNRYNWAVFSGLIMLLFTSLQFNYTDSSIWLDIILMAASTFILLSALNLKGAGLI